MATAVSVSATGNAEIDGLLGGTKWSGSITFSFPDSPNDYPSSGYSQLNEPAASGFGPAPAAMQPPPADSATGFLITFDQTGGSTCIGGSQFPFPQEPPNWTAIPAVEATIQATITNNPVIAPNQTVTVFSVLFPPAAPNYPEATYLWTWYVPQNATGTVSRPVTFMQSQSGVGVGTSLALADYFFYQDFVQPIPPANFDIPSSCSAQTRKLGLRHRLP